MLEKRVDVSGRSLCANDCVGLTVKNQGETPAMYVRFFRLLRYTVSDSKLALLFPMGQAEFH